MKFGGLEFGGLDIETTGSDIDAGAAIIQIGVTFGGYQAFVSDIKPHAGAVIVPEAMAVNKITQERMDAAPSAAEVDENLSQWLISQGIEPRRFIAIGWNVAGFDIPFVKRYLPKTFKFLSYRTVDLNAIVFTLDPVRGQDRLKKQLKTWTEEGLDGSAHDALFDATSAIEAWRILVEALAPRVVKFPTGIADLVAVQHGEDI